jgi:hypothetical protein
MVSASSKFSFSLSLRARINKLECLSPEIISHLSLIFSSKTKIKLKIERRSASVSSELGKECLKGTNQGNLNEEEGSVRLTSLY